MIFPSFLGKVVCYLRRKHKRSKRVQLNGVEFMRCPRCGFLRTAKPKSDAAVHNGRGG